MLINQKSIQTSTLFKRFTRVSTIFECYFEADVPLKTHSMCQAAAHLCRSFHEPITSRPSSLIVSYHLPFNLMEKNSLRCELFVSVFFVEFVFGGHFPK